MLGRHHENAVGGHDRLLHPLGALREVRLQILIVERQVVGSDELDLEGIGRQLRDRLGELAVDRTGPIAADDDGELEFRHGRTLG